MQCVHRVFIKMGKMRGEVGKKTLEKRWKIPHSYDVMWLIFERLSPPTGFREKKIRHDFINSNFQPTSHTYAFSYLKKKKTLIN